MSDAEEPAEDTADRELYESLKRKALDDGGLDEADFKKLEELNGKSAEKYPFTRPGDLEGDEI